MSSELAIEVLNISKSYATYKSSLQHVFSLLFGTAKKTTSTFNALTDVSFTVNKGETLGIVGSNGAGKSTLLQIICGTLYPTSGSVTVHGKFAALLELGAGFNPEFTGRENVYLSAAVYGLTHAQIDARLNDILSFAEIGEFIDKPVKTYSSGMFVRLAFAIIAHVDADILVIDEALAVGDIYFTQKCMRFLKAFAEQGTLLFVSHDTTSVVNLCDRAIWLKNGQMQKIGNARDVSEAYLSSVYENKLPDTVTITGDDGSVFESAQFGVGGGRILSCLLLDAEGNNLRILDRAQSIVVQVEVQALQIINQPIVGFFIKNRLGQHLFGTNT
ncbi:MAG TPA: ABC transporter ATP-binding protein, partial [Oligella sp.]|nr:ABC transporter ATP-binding protein [Oligella sp.]